jgi:hypothetical protein
MLAGHWLTNIRNEYRRDIVVSVAALFGQFGAIIVKLCFTKTICMFYASYVQENLLGVWFWGLMQHALVWDA